MVKAYLDWRPSGGVALGLHEYDGKSPDLSAASVQREAARLRADLEVLDTALDPKRVGRADERTLFDARVLRAALAGELFSFEGLRSFTNNPMTYAAGPDVSIYLVRDFAPLAQRLRSVIARLDSAPRHFADARANLAPVLPRPLVETAVKMARGSADFLLGDMAKEFRKVEDDALRKEFARVSEQAAKEARDFAAWLEKERLPKSDASFALGREKFRRFLAATELVDMDPDEILRLGMEELKREQARFDAAAREIDPSKPAIEVFRAVQKDHPTAEGLLPETARGLEEIRGFLVARDIITLPSEVRAQVRETLPFARATSFASMDTPGPFETKATEAYYYVTPVEKDWTPKQAEEWLTAFNRPTTAVVSIHEAYPGHYVQFLHLNASKASRIGKICSSYAFVEGWAHYTELMMAEEGFGAQDGDKLRAAKIRLAQSDEALLRLCRLCSAVMLHCQGKSVAEAAKFFEDNCHYEPKPSLSEATRGTFDPGYLNYTLGKLQILKLRADWKRQEGDKFTLKRFHDELLRHGSPPLRLLRAVMLRDPAEHDHVLE